jgi:ADP-ribose pyrophosphatase YjhB (NUDIX family)
MLRKTIGKFWKILPRGVRTRIVRATQNTFTVSVAAIIVNERQEVLLLDHVLRPRSGWGFPGGFLDANEHAQAAVEREVSEETGLALENVRLMRVFAARPVGEASVQSSEIYRLGWFAVESLPEGTTLAQKMLIGEVLNSEI